MYRNQMIDGGSQNHVTNTCQQCDKHVSTTCNNSYLSTLGMVVGARVVRAKDPRVFLLEVEELEVGVALLYGGAPAQDRMASFYTNSPR